MPTSIYEPTSARHVLSSEIRPRMAKADLPDVRKAETDEWRARVGAAIERTRMLCGHSLKEFADLVGRDERQVSRWIAGTERPQLDAIFMVDAFRQPLIVALAELAQGDGVEIVTEIRVRRIA